MPSVASSSSSKRPTHFLSRPPSQGSRSLVEHGRPVRSALAIGETGAFVERPRRLARAEIDVRRAALLRAASLSEGVALRSQLLKPLTHVLLATLTPILASRCPCSGTGL
jgi:hypothetical protein